MPFSNVSRDSTSLDALVVGAGFGGIYQLYTLVQLGFNVKCIDKAGGAGGVWYRNNYPGVMTDTESFLYRYSFDKEDLVTYPWPNNYLTRDEVLKYLTHVIKKHHLWSYLQFSTELICAKWSDTTRKWHVETSNGDSISTTYLFTAMGLHGKQNWPEFPGLDTFQGTITHTESWNVDHEARGKRVGIIGCGSSGVQVSGAIAPVVAELRCFIRSPQYSVPSRLRAISSLERTRINQRYGEIIQEQVSSRQGHGYPEPSTRTMSVSSEERRRVFEELWQQGNGFRFLYGGFSDLASDIEASEQGCQFLRDKIKAAVVDPATAALLTPQELFSRRPVCDRGYYEIFNRGNVVAVDLKKTPIVSFEKDGIITSDSVFHPLDMIVLATGFESGTGPYKSVRGGIHGRGGRRFDQHWENGVATYLGMFVSSFPNLFMVNGPQGSFGDAPRNIESEVDFLTAMIKAVQRERGDCVIECTPEAEAEWGLLCNKLAASETLVMKTKSWLTGANASNGSPSIMFYFGGLNSYRAILCDVAMDDYRGLTIG